MHNEASRDTLEREFGTSNDQEVIFHMLEKGEIQESFVSTNLSFISPSIVHIHFRYRYQSSVPCS
jgi:hypothetical protein